MKLTTMTQVTLDGVMQGNGGNRDQERSLNGFDRGGWALVLGDNATDTAIDDFYARADAFLFGRRTYDLFSDSWGAMAMEDAPGWERTWRALHDRPKYVVSSSLTDPAWTGTSVLTDDLVTAVRDLKASAGGELQVHGSGTLVRQLLEHDLIDEMTLVTVPVILGQGDRLFPERGPAIALELLGSSVDSDGVTVQRFRPADRPPYPGE